MYKAATLTIEVYTDLVINTGSFNVKVTALDPKTGITNSNLVFNVAIRCVYEVSVLTSMVASTTYYMHSPKKSQAIVLPNYQLDYDECWSVLSYKVVSTVDNSCKPWFDCVTAPTGNLMIGTEDSQYIGTHVLKV